MKSQGGQHGMPRSFPILPKPRPKTRLINRLRSPPTMFNAKCALPRCNVCHVAPSSKSRHRAKGANKLKSSDARPGLTLSGLSVTRMLDHLSVDEPEDEGDEELVSDYTARPKDSYSFADLFGSGDDDENGFCEDDWVINEFDEAFISEMGLQMEHYEVEEDRDWYFVESNP